MKMVKEKLYEGLMDFIDFFSEGPGDPIKDMKIGTDSMIEKWLKEMQVEQYRLTKKHLINVYNNVILENKDISQFPEYIKFNHIIGGFHIKNTNLISLDGCPYSITGSFVASFNKLRDLKGGPHIVKEIYSVSHNFLESLEGLAESIGTSIYINDNNLKDLKYIPDVINGDLNIKNNPIETLKYFPKEIEGNLIFTETNIVNKTQINKKCRVWGHFIYE